jgi:hypothetical protein
MIKALCEAEVSCPAYDKQQSQKAALTRQLQIFKNNFVKLKFV